MIVFMMGRVTMDNRDNCKKSSSEKKKSFGREKHVNGWLLNASCLDKGLVWKLCG